MPVVPGTAAHEGPHARTGVGSTGHWDCAPKMQAARGIRVQEKSGHQQQEKQPRVTKLVGLHQKLEGPEQCLCVRAHKATDWRHLSLFNFYSQSESEVGTRVQAGLQ